MRPFFIRICIILLAWAAWNGSSVEPKATAQNAVKNPGHLKMGLVNIKSLYSDTSDAKTNRANIDANLTRHFYFIDRLAAEGVEFIGFPELSVNGYHFSKTMTWLSLDGPEVKALQKKAIDKGIYISAGIALQDADGKRWNAQIVIDPQGRIIGLHKKIWLTNEKGHTEAGSEHKVFDVKGMKMGIAICADGTDRKNLEALAKNGAQIIYGPHCNSTGGTTAGWYKFRAAWGGPEGWIAQLKVYAALHNNAGLYNPEFDPASAKGPAAGWASGAWFIGPDGKTLAQMPSSTQKNDSKEYILIYNVPLPGAVDDGSKEVKSAPGADKGGKALFDGKTMTGWKSANFGGEGEVHIQDGALVMEVGNDMTGIAYTRGDFPMMDYEVTLEGKKLKGRDFFCTTTFPVGKEHCSLVVGGWGGTVVGLSSIDFRDASENDTTTLKDFKHDQWYRIRIRVTKERIEAWIDDKQVVDQVTKDHKIDIRVECDPCKPFGVATWRTAGAVRDIRLRLLTAAELKAPPKKD